MTPPPRCRGPPLLATPAAAQTDRHAGDQVLPLGAVAGGRYPSCRRFLNSDIRVEGTGPVEVTAVQREE